ncbi:FadR/GntR family transcriptional regulator [Arthrobacter halodurans]|uniref:FadR/GntR family transcriptional regulator n=1 Tax=Arthrobacter halodurans TaxID=516699 RepID=A0ABV4UQ85_9MICC
MSRNLTATLAAALRADIVDGTIAPGDKLPSESTLIAEHGVSRTVVREAITRLQAEGLVHTRRGAGSYALTPPAETAGGGAVRPARTLGERTALLEYRAGLESEAAALAALRRRQEHLAALRSCLRAFDEAAGSPADMLASDFDFHSTVARASGNAFFVDAVQALGPAMISMPRGRLEAEGDTRARAAQVGAEHAAVLAALEAGDPVSAAAAMRTHLVNSRRRVESEAGR